jgi:hypothetical protein
MPGSDMQQLVADSGVSEPGTVDRDEVRRFGES